MIKKDTQNEIQCNCPLCGDKKFRLHLYHDNQKGVDLVHCFNAGCSLDTPITLQKALKYLSPDLEYEYKMKKISSLKKLKSPFHKKDEYDIQDVLSTIKKRVDKTGNSNINFSRFFIECKKSEKCKKYIESRKIPKDFYDDIWYSDNMDFFEYKGEKEKKYYIKNSIIIPIIDYSKVNLPIKGFYSRGIDEKRFSTFLLPGSPKFWSNCKYSEIEIITESIFDAMSTGFNKIGAMLSADLDPNVKEELKKDVIICVDNDETGRKKLEKKYIKEGYRVFIPPKEYKYKDFNEALQDGMKIQEIKKMIKDNTYSGVMAIVKLRSSRI